MEQKTYAGLITESDCGDNYQALWVGDSVIAKELDEDINGKMVSVRYWISDTEKSKQELQEDLIKRISGAIDADYGDRYSDLTGYLWTDEELKIGGHDILNELRNNVGKFLYMIIDIH
jgi:hypothetical protein